MSTIRTLPCRNNGFTLMELVIVVVVLGILSIAAFTTQTSSSEMTLPGQAESMAASVRKAQTLAITSGWPVTFTATSAGYSADCSPSCASGAFSAVFLKGVTSSAGSVSFSSNGQPAAATSFTLTVGSSTKTLAVAATTGHVTVSP